MNQGEFWTWVQDPMTKGLYPDEWYNGEPFKESELGYINFYLRLVTCLCCCMLEKPRRLPSCLALYPTRLAEFSFDSSACPMLPALRGAL